MRISPWHDLPNANHNRNWKSYSEEYAEEEKATFRSGGSKMGLNKDWFMVYDKYPVSDGHILVVPRRQVQRLSELTPREWVSLGLALDAVRAYHMEFYAPEGINIGINQGEAAGQTVSVLHIHCIPRYTDDMEDPEGGVRGVIPWMQKYDGSLQENRPEPFSGATVIFPDDMKIKEIDMCMCYECQIERYKPGDYPITNTTTIGPDACTTVAEWEDNIPEDIFVGQGMSDTSIENIEMNFVLEDDEDETKELCERLGPRFRELHCDFVRLGLKRDEHIEYLKIAEMLDIELGEEIPSHLLADCCKGSTQICGRTTA